MSIKKIAKFSIFFLVANIVIFGNNLAKADDLKNKATYIEGDLSIELNTKNTLELTLDTQNILFDGYNGTSDFHNNFNVTVSSSLNYNINMKMNEEFKNTKDPSQRIRSSLIYVQEPISNNEISFSEVDKYFNLVHNSEASTDTIHPMTLILKSGSQTISGNYKTSFTIQAIQN